MFYNGILDFIPGFHENLDELSYDELKPYLTAAFQHLYLGPAAAGSQEHNDDNGKHGGSKSKATMYGLTKVTPQAWAWAMCAVWFSLSACNSYKMCIGSFNLEEFFFAIIETLNDPEDPWAVDTLAWINEQVFGKHVVKAMTTTSDYTDSDLVKIHKPVPKAKLVPKAWSKTHDSARLSGGDIQVEEPTNEVGGADIPDVEAPAPPKKKPAPRRGKKAA
ncbi:hypothetical protein F4604DRAFT_1927301 [Suillus subluteus]|nr:hypothetical protein F4604DRAFT_1927301 [Suillus subluteus]